MRKGWRNPALIHLHPAGGPQDPGRGRESGESDTSTVEYLTELSAPSAQLVPPLQDRYTGYTVGTT